MSSHRGVQDVLIMNTGVINAAIDLSIDKQRPGELAPPVNKFWLTPANDYAILRPSMKSNPGFVASDPFFHVAVHRQVDTSSEFYYSMPIHKRLIRSAWFKNFVAPVSRTVTIDCSGCPAPIIGQVYGLTVHIHPRQVIPMMDKFFQIVATSTSMNAVLQQMANHINTVLQSFGQSRYPMVRAISPVVGTNLVITNLPGDEDVQFDVAFQEGFAGAVTITVPPIIGFGIYRDVLEHENESIGQRYGHANRWQFPASPVYKTSPVVAPQDYTAGYGAVTILHENPVERSTDDNFDSRPIITTFYLPNAQVVAFKTVLETVTGYDIVDAASLWNLGDGLITTTGTTSIGIPSGN